MICTGVGVWGSNSPCFWAWDITNFIFWVSMAHAGSLISALLFLTRQKWSISISRAAEAMTVFAIICAGVYPAIHIGRVWFVWFLFPVPNSYGMWPNFSSPLLWDVFAVTSYLTVSSLFWFAGMIPDLAVLRDRATTKIRKFCYGLFSLGWLGTARQWRHYEMMYILLAGLTSEAVGVQWTLTIFAAAAAVAGTVYVVLTAPIVRRLEREEAAASVKNDETPLALTSLSSVSSPPASCVVNV